MDDLKPIDKTTHDYAYWLADKIPAFGDYGKDCANTLRQQANRITQLEAGVAELKRKNELLETANTMNSMAASNNAWVADKYDKENADLRAKLEAAEKDAGRMNYLESGSEWDIGRSDSAIHEGEIWYEIKSIDGHYNDREYNTRGGGRTIRKAIDAAMEAKP